MASRTTPATFHPVQGLPKSACIYRIAASKNWQFRVFLDGKYHRQSTGETDKTRAKEKAKDLYKEIIVRSSFDLPIHSTSFAAVARRFLTWQEAQVVQGSLGERTHKEDVYILNRDVLPFFHAKDVATVAKPLMDEYLSTLTERRLSKSTLNKHINVLRKILNFALDNDFIKAIPKFPSIGLEHKPRPYFKLDDYAKLLSAAYEYAYSSRVADYCVSGKVVRRLKYTLDFADLIAFSAQVFIRISDIKDLKHRHINVVKEHPVSKATFLEITVPHSKTVADKSVTLEKAVEIYARIRGRHTSIGFGKPDDYVFYPQFRDRNYALDELGRLLRNILTENDLRHDERGRPRTLYSLRHTAIMFRFLYGDKVDLLLLAKNAMTSVQMLEKHYLAHVQAETRIDELQSWKGGSVLYEQIPIDMQLHEKHMAVAKETDQNDSSRLVASVRLISLKEKRRQRDVGRRDSNTPKKFKP